MADSQIEERTAGANIGCASCSDGSSAGRYHLSHGDGTYTVQLEPAEQGGHVVTVPSLPGCVTQGETYEEALTMAEECIRGFIEALAKAGQPVPREAEKFP